MRASRGGDIKGLLLYRPFYISEIDLLLQLGEELINKIIFFVAGLPQQDALPVRRPMNRVGLS